MVKIRRDLIFAVVKSPRDNVLSTTIIYLCLLLMEKSLGIKIIFSVNKIAEIN